jgi:soluble lytic murein transglycosylase
MPDSTVRRFFGAERPTSAVGRLALARVLRDEGDRAGAEREVRAVWQSAELSAELKTTMLEAFRDELTPADHRGRMDRRIGAKGCSAFRRRWLLWQSARATPFLRLTSCSHVCVRHSA